MGACVKNPTPIVANGAFVYAESISALNWNRDRAAEAVAAAAATAPAAATLAPIER